MTDELVTYEDQNEGELATIDKTLALSPVLEKMLTNGAYTSFDTSTTSGKKMTAKVKTASDALSRYEGTPIAIKDIVIAPGTHQDKETGEVRNVFMTYLIDEDGMSHFSKSRGIAESAATILDDCGEPETWDEPIEVIVRTTLTNEGRQWKYLDPQV